jgi:hypothetical protein
MIRNTFIPVMLISLFTILFISCSSGKITKNPVEKPSTGAAALEKGIYELGLLDSSGGKLVELELNVDVSDSTGFSGTSKITKVYNNAFKGFGNLTGGSFTGSYNKFDSSIAVINMNPNAQDNNIYLTLYVFGKNITGSWSYSTFTGIANKGTLVQIIK